MECIALPVNGTIETEYIDNRINRIGTMQEAIAATDAVMIIVQILYRSGIYLEMFFATTVQFAQNVAVIYVIIKIVDKESSKRSGIADANIVNRIFPNVSRRIASHICSSYLPIPIKLVDSYLRTVAAFISHGANTPATIAMATIIAHNIPA
jgi:hypothetical protein